jgi:hypothetical protein
MLGKKLRECELEYQEMSDYLNVHIVVKLREEKISNKNYCMRVSSFEQQLTELKEERKANSVES